MLPIPVKYRGIFFMLLAALGFSVMGGAAKLLKANFNAGQLVFYRNAIGLLVLLVGLWQQPVVKKIGGKLKWLLFRGMMGTLALYMLLYCILHIPLGTAMTYNLTSTLFIALFSFLLFKEFHGSKVLLAVLLGFLGMLLVYQPAMHFPWYYNVAGLISGVSSAIAYLTVGRLNTYYDARIIVLSFVVTGVLAPLLLLGIRLLFQLPADAIFFIEWQWPAGIEWLWMVVLGVAALFGQYFVTLAYGADKAGIVSAISYANIVFSVFIGQALGDPFPDMISLAGIICIIVSGVIISLVKRKTELEQK
ncbi:MAG: DMT family transporter [Sphingobacteriales bacterium]|nr:MAG: DMT family transporter [Sphingobacteriales bacterium]